MRNIPPWFPGAGFKRKAKFWRKNLSDNDELPFRETKKRFVGPPNVFSEHAA